jgi:hypothetical protein
MPPQFTLEISHRKCEIVLREPVGEGASESLTGKDEER